MLSSLCIQNFTTVENFELDFSQGLTSITGETGAGKSVLLDALSLALGSRTRKDTLRDAAQSAEVSAVFSFDASHPLPPAAHGWLLERELIEELDDACESDVLLRRVVKPDGRSKAFINSCPVPLSDLKKLGEQLVDLHNQHEYQSLLKRATQQQLLDDFAGNLAEREAVSNLASQWKSISQKIAELSNGGEDQQAKRQLLQYQVQELDALAAQSGEVSTLESEQKLLSEAENLQGDLHKSLQLLQSDNGSGIIDMTSQTLQLVRHVQQTLPDLSNCKELLESAQIQLIEAKSELEQSRDIVVSDPERLAQVETRLNALYDIARKHQVAPELVDELHARLAEQLHELDNSDQLLADLQQQSDELVTQYHSACAKLRKSRQSAAKTLKRSIKQQLSALNLAHCEFEIDILPLDNGQVSANGSETVEFLISTIPGKAAGSLARIASGGELSRISLAIQVVTAKTSSTPTLVFDEVDVGIGGGTAEVVGNLLRELGNSGQVLCVTHQAQVAAKGHQHLRVSKQTSRKSADTRFDLLDRKLRKEELARMLGGIDVTESTLAHAEDILNSA